MAYETARADALNTAMPSGTDRYIGLWDGDPVNGGTEITLAGYARKAFQDWTTNSTPTSSTRQNVSAITFAVITGVGQATHWAIHDDPAGVGVIRRSGDIRNLVGAPTPIIFTGGGDTVEFPIGTLMVRLDEG